MAGMKIQFKRLYPGSYMNVAQKMARGIWPWTEGPRARLPLHYKLRYMEKTIRDPLPVHYKPDEGKYKVDKWGKRLLVQNTPVPIIFPQEADEGLWGGEGFLQGLKKKKERKRIQAVWRLWKPFLTERAFYSEILDEHLKITVSMRTLELVDEAKGFDHYILDTHEVDLASKLGMRLKRKMLQALLDKSMCPNDPEKREEIFKRYEKYMVPQEEIEWLGLSMGEAERKQLEIDEALRKANMKPLKEEYMDELIEILRNNRLQELEVEIAEKGEGGLLQKINPFKS